MKRNGTTKAGTLRWRCKNPDCGVSLVRKNNADAAGLATFLKWLLKPLAQGEMSDSTSRTFRRKTAKYWAYWPLPHFRDESVSVLHVDGLHMGRKGVILIGCNEAGTPLGWYLARTEHAGAWSALLAQISTPLMVVTDGGSGFRKAMKDTWPQVRIQRCLFHVYLNITALTSKRPRLAPGRELKWLAHQLLAAKTPKDAWQWEQDYLAWEARWAGFLAEKSVYATGEYKDTHAKLVRARNLVRTLLRQGQLFTFLSPALLAASGLETLPSTNSRLEGGINAQIRRMWGWHRGMPFLHRVKAAYWWCYTHSPSPLPAARILGEMPTDATIEALYQDALQHHRQHGPVKWGTAISWEDLHHKTWKQ